MISEDAHRRRDPRDRPWPRRAAALGLGALVCTGCAAGSPRLPAESPAAPSAAAAPSSRPAARTARALGWVALSVGAEAAIVSAVTSVVLLHEKSVRDDSCNAAKACSQRGLDANSTIDTLVPWNTAAWIVTALGLGAGGYLVLSHRPEKARGTGIAVSPSPSGVTVEIRSAF
jgi:hypothetical protein